MENYYSNHLSLKQINGLNEFPPTKQVSQSLLMDKVMPLYQIIRFANQAAEKKQVIYATIEQAATNGKFNRTTLKGRFCSSLNDNRQIIFMTENNNVIYLLKIDQILTIELVS